MDTKKNYYKILGVEKKFDFDTLKKKYREMSKKYHPDLNNGETKDIFADINEAYNILSDATSRKKYDTSSPHGANYDMKSELYNFTFSNKNVQYDELKKKYDNLKENAIDIYIEMPDFDDTVTINFIRKVPCDSCDKTGLNLNCLLFDCDMCNSTGIFNDVKCTVCVGKGKVGFDKCSVCSGNAITNLKVEYILNKNMFVDNKLKIVGMGNHSKTDFRVGNLYIKIKE